MRCGKHLGFRVLPWWGAAAVVAAVCWSGPVRAEPFPPDPVAALRQALRTPPEDQALQDPELARRLQAAKQPEDRPRILAQARDRALTRAVDNLRTLSQMHRALALPDWGEEQEFGAPLPRRLITSQEELATATERNRARLLDRFRQAVFRTLRQGDPTARLALMRMLQEMATNPRTGERTGVGQSFGPELADLVRHGEPPAVREAAARTLGQIFPDPKQAIPALRSLLSSGSAPERRAAAAGLLGMMRLLAQPPAATTRTGVRPEIDRAQLVAGGQLIVSAAGAGLRDPDREVRRQSTEAIQEAAAALLNQLPSPRELEEALTLEVERPEAGLAQRGLLPLIRALRDQAPALSQAVSDPDLQVRIAARRAFEDLGMARQRLLRLPPAPEAVPSEVPLEPGAPGRGGAGPSNGGGSEGPPPPAAAKPSASEALLLEALRTALPALIRGLSDPVVEGRLEALDALEFLGPTAAPAIPALLRALYDPNKFVRWAAARTLGKIGPAEEQKEVVAGLARLLQNQDLSVEMAAATALEQFGPAAQAALPALVQAMGIAYGPMRMGAMRAIEAIGTAAAPAIPALTAALNDPDARVRQTAAEVLARFGPLARSAEATLRQHLNDTSPEVRRAVSDALLDITQE